MNKFFNYVSMGLEIKHPTMTKEDMTLFRDFIPVDQLENLFNTGFCFYSPTHHVTLESMDDYEKYLGEVAM